MRDTIEHIRHLIASGRLRETFRAMRRFWCAPDGPTLSERQKNTIILLEYQYSTAVYEHINGLVADRVAFNRVVMGLLQILDEIEAGCKIPIQSTLNLRPGIKKVIFC